MTSGRRRRWASIASWPVSLSPSGRGRHFSAARVLVLSLIALITAGTILLWLPAASTRGALALVDAFFTATSAVCVTGLIVVDTPDHLSLFGQLVVLILIQAGGLGYMAITTVVGAALGRQLTVHERVTLQEALNVQSLEGLARFTIRIFKIIAVLELLGAAALTLRWMGEYGLMRAAYYGVFHAVSAFNNAGFALFPDSLIRYRDDWVVNLVISSLVIAGGLGFVVLAELRGVRDRRQLSTHTRLVLLLSVGLIVIGTVAILLLERANPRTLGSLPWGEAVLAAFFQSVSSRTAGFNTIDIGAMAPASLFLLLVLMFIGAAPGGTGGGVKVTTFSVTVAMIWAIVRGGAEPVLLRRRIAPEVVARAFAICLIGFLALNVVTGLLLVLEDQQLLQTLFEATSAFGTVGLSTGYAGAALSLSGYFSISGKVLLAALMFMGRVGPLTLAVAIARGGSPPRVRHPEGRFLVG